MMVKKSMLAYQKLEEIFEEIGNINGALSVLHWDSATMMPSGGAEARSQQISTLTTIAHNKLTAPQMSDYLSAAKADIIHLNDWQRSNLTLMEHNYKHAKAVDEKLVTALSQAGSKCEIIWRKARADNDFEIYQEPQQEVLNLVREVAQAKSEAFKCSRYNALLDQYDAGRTTQEIEVIFDDLEAFLPDFIAQAMEKQASYAAIKPLQPPYPIHQQKELGLVLMKALNFNFSHGRLDISHHPFCGGISDDVRVTTRYDESDFTSAMMGILHETGHALYEQNLPKEYKYQPVGQALGMSIHESQSLLIEMQVCRSQEFFEYVSPIIANIFSHGGAELSAENLKCISNQVKPDLIRVDADEVTYPAHVILRYKLEKSLINGEMEVKNIPDAWKELMQKLLNVKVTDFKNGCMQDIHWTDGSFGYFPTYTLGAIHSAEFYNQAKINNPEIKNAIRDGNFTPLVTWLEENIHTKASKLTANELLFNVTGKKLNAEIFKKHLTDRYL